MASFTSILSKLPLASTTGVQLSANDFTAYPSIQQLFHSFFPRGLSLGAYTGGTVTGNIYAVTATLTSSFKGLKNLQANFEFDASVGIELKLTLSQLPTNWKLSKAYPSIAGSLLDEIELSGQTFVLDSAQPTVFDAAFFSKFNDMPEVNQTPGTISNVLGFQALINLNDGLAWILNGGSPISLQIDGHIGELASGEPIVSIQPAKTTVKVDILGADFFFSAGFYSLPAVSGLFTQGPIIFGQVEADIPYKTFNAATFKGRFKDLLMTPLGIEVELGQDNLGLDTIDEIFGGKAGDFTKDVIPSSFYSLISQIKILRLSCLYLVTNKHIYSYSITIGSGSSTPIANYNPSGLAKSAPFSFDKFTLTFTLLNNPKVVFVDVDASATIFGVAFNADFSFPSLDFMATLNSPLTLDVVMQEIDIDPNFHLPALASTTIDGLSIQGNLEGKYYTVSAALNTNWVLSGFTFEGFAFTIAYGSLFKSCDFEASVKINSTPFTVYAGYDNGTFKGSINNIQIDLSKVMAHFASDFSSAASVIAKELPSGTTITVDSIGFSHTSSSIYSFNVEVSFGNTKASIFFEKDPSLTGSGGELVTVSIGGVHIAAGAGEYLFAYIPQNGPKRIDVTSMVLDGLTNLKVPSPEIASLTSLLPALEITVTAGVIYYSNKTPAKAKILVYLAAEERLSLTNLQVIGKFLEDEVSASIAISGLVYNQGNDSSDLIHIESLLSTFKSNPGPAGGASQAIGHFSIPTTLGEGIEMTVELAISDWKAILNIGQDQNAAPTKDSGCRIPIGDPTSSAGSGPNPPLPQDLGDGLKHVQVNKSFGPATIQSIGFKLGNGIFEAAFTGTLSLGPLAFDLVDLAITNRLNKFDPVFGLTGLGVAFNKGGISVAGMLEHQLVGTNEEFNGGILCNIPDASISVFGSFTAKNPTSLFAYGFLGAPLLDIVIVELNGLAAGIGVNRQLVLPLPANISNFPLVSAAEGSPPPGTNASGNNGALLKRLGNMIRQLGTNIPVTSKEYFFAFGIRGSVVELIEVFILMVPEFGATVKLNAFGILSLAVPTDEPLAEIQIAFDMGFDPEEGIMTAGGALTPNSYLFSKNASITGSFAYFAAFKNQTNGDYAGARAGGFAMVAGSYGPFIKTESYYPKVQPLELNWKVSNNFNITASVYFAMVPHALAVGGSLHATYTTGGKHFSAGAAFDINADFFIHWKPLRYRAAMSLEFKAWGTVNLIIHKTFNINVSAGLNVWGPSFSGNATLKVHILFTFHVHISWGDPDSPSLPISWDTFKTNFLPADPSIVSARTNAGKVKQLTALQQVAGKTIQYDVVNPKEFQITIASIIPITDATLNGGLLKTPIPSIGTLGIWPMQVGVNTPLSSTFHMIIESLYGSSWKQSGPNKTDLWELTPILKNVPTALWRKGQDSFRVPDEVSNDSLIENVFSGFKINAPKPTPQHTTGAIPMANMRFDIFQGNSSTSVSTPSYGLTQFVDVITATQTVQNALQPTSTILSDLGFGGVLVGAIEFYTAPLFQK